MSDLQLGTLFLHFLCLLLDASLNISTSHFTSTPSTFEVILQLTSYTNHLLTYSADCVNAAPPEHLACSPAKFDDVLSNFDAIHKCDRQTYRTAITHTAPHSKPVTKVWRKSVNRYWRYRGNIKPSHESRTDGQTHGRTAARTDDPKTYSLRRHLLAAEA